MINEARMAALVGIQTQNPFALRALSPDRASSSLERSSSPPMLNSLERFSSSQIDGPTKSSSPRQGGLERSLSPRNSSFRSQGSSSGDVPHYALPTTNSFRLQKINSFRSGSPKNGSPNRTSSPPMERLNSFTRTPFAVAEPPQPAESAALRMQIDAQLTINSLILLGFDSDEYVKSYSGIAFDLLPLNRDTFHHSGGDKMLLIILHYLLCILDPELFLRDIKTCWPYLDARERNAFKSAVHASMRRLVDQSVVSGGVYQATHLNNSNKYETWRLLRALTDVCIENMLPETPVGDDDVTGETDKEVLLNMLDAQLEKVVQMLSDHQDVTDEYRTYLQELVDRVYAANRLIAKQQQQSERSTSGSQHSTNVRNKKKILGTKGMKLRQDKIEKINRQRDLLQGFMDTQLLQDIERFLQQDEEQSKQKAHSNGKVGDRRALRKAKTMTVEDLELYKAQVKDSIGQLISTIDSVCDVV